jgi:oxygen-dependent protoporphyrinogen oxidase
MSDQIADIDYSSSATVVLAFRQDAFKTPPACFGFVVPQTENMHTLACAFNNIKFKGRAPAGCILLRAFVGGALRPDDLRMTDDQMAAAVQRELTQLMGLAGQPIFSRVFRYHRAMPQYHVGHMDRARQIRLRAAQYPGLALAGNAYGGVGIPDCITSGEAAAESVLHPLIRNS